MSKKIRREGPPHNSNLNCAWHGSAALLAPIYAQVEKRRTAVLTLNFIKNYGATAPKVDDLSLPRMASAACMTMTAGCVMQ